MNYRRTRGAALLILMSLILIALTTVAISRLSLNRSQTTRTTTDVKTLATARDGLLGYALRQPFAGKLPCPDRNGDGNQDRVGGPNTACRARIGWLPFRTLDLPDLRDSSNARLWYSVAPGYTLDTVDSATLSALHLDGSNIVAVILAPTEILSGQTRINHTANFTDTFVSTALVTGYLEGVNSVANTTAFTRLVNANQNDQALGITVTEFWDTMNLLLP